MTRCSEASRASSCAATSSSSPSPSSAESFRTPLIGLVRGGGELGGAFVVDEQVFTWGAFVSRLVTFVMTAALIYFPVVLPTRALVQRRARGEGHGPVQPTQVELLTEIRDLPRAPQNGPVQGAAGPPAGPREPANGAG